MYSNQKQILSNFPDYIKKKKQNELKMECVMESSTTYENVIEIHFVFTFLIFVKLEGSLQSIMDFSCTSSSFSFLAVHKIMTQVTIYDN